MELLVISGILVILVLGVAIFFGIRVFDLKRSSDLKDIDFLNSHIDIIDSEIASSVKEVKKDNDMDIYDMNYQNVISRKINDLNRGIKIIILTSHNDEQEVIQSLKAGANAYCSKEINPVRLLEVAASVLDGASWFDPSIAHIVLRAASNTQMNDV